MSPLIPIAINLLPELAKRLAGGDKGETIDRVTSVVRDVLRTGDPEEAALAAQDPAKAAELRIRLAEIEAEAEAKRQDTIIATLEARRAADSAVNDARFRELTAHMGSQADARDKALRATETDSVYQYGPLAMSVIVTIGFFVLLILLIIGSLKIENANILQIINIGFGTLTAGFATVISFWLGSSDSSRKKDIINVEMQRQRGNDTKTMLARQSQQTESIMKQQTAQAQQLINRADRVATPTANLDRPDATLKSAHQFGDCIANVLEQEAVFAGRTDDPRGVTKQGVTRQMLAAWRETDVTGADLAQMDEQEAKQVHRSIGWNALGCQDMPSGIDLMMLDYAADFGVRSAATALQNAVAVEADGQIGPVTLGAVKQFKARQLLDDLRGIREGFNRNRAGALTLGEIWNTRVQTIHDTACDMLRD